MIKEYKVIFKIEGIKEIKQTFFGSASDMTYFVLSSLNKYRQYTRILTKTKFMRGEYI